MTKSKRFGRKVVVGSAISMMALGSMFGTAYAEGDGGGGGGNPAPPGPVPNPPSLQDPPSTPIPLPGGGA